MDYRMYLNRLLRYGEATGTRLLAYCPMPNHYHLVPRTGETELAALMLRLNTSYTRYFNDRWTTVGHLFQGRYGARRCKTDNDLRIAIRYVHMNPVQDGLVSRPEDWPWSGHRGLLAGHDPILDVSAVLDLFGGLQAYLDFLAIPPNRMQQPSLDELLEREPAEIREVITGPARDNAGCALRRKFVVLALQNGYRMNAIAKKLNRTPSAISQLVKGLNSEG
jgi:REP element-mobilizing transposase RayT